MHCCIWNVIPVEFSDAYTRLWYIVMRCDRQSNVCFFLHSYVTTINTSLHSIEQDAYVNITLFIKWCQVKPNSQVFVNWTSHESLGRQFLWWSAPKLGMDNHELLHINVLFALCHIFLHNFHLVSTGKSIDRWLLKNAVTA